MPNAPTMSTAVDALANAKCKRLLQMPAAKLLQIQGTPTTTGLQNRANDYGTSREAMSKPGTLIGVC